MRKKVGTILEQEVLNQARRAASADGKTLAAFIEEALVAHLSRRHDVTVDDVKGIFQLTRAQLSEVLESDPYDS